MVRVFCHSVRILIGLSLLLMPAAAEAATDRGKYSRWVWQPTAHCPERPEEGAPGSSPGTAITFEHFFNLAAFALLEAKSDDAIGISKNQKPIPVNCKWVRLTGFFDWDDYRDFRGSLWADAKAYYFDLDPPPYIVENFGKSSVRRGAFHHRRVTLVGRFYNYCAGGENGDETDAPEKPPAEAGTPEPAGEDGEQVIFIHTDGLCYHGPASGMALGDVFVEKVHDEAPRFLGGERDRDIIRELVPYTADDLETLVDRTRAWAALVKSGARAFARKTIASNPKYAEFGKRYTERFRKSVTSPDSYISWLSNLPAFRKLNTKTAQVAIFRNQRHREDRRDHESVGCICLTGDCAGRWPLLDRDADYFVGAAACTTLSRSAEDPVWRW